MLSEYSRVLALRNIACWTGHGAPPSRFRSGPRGRMPHLPTTARGRLGRQPKVSFSVTAVILLSKVLKPAPPNGATNNLYNKLLVRPDEYQELPHHLITRIIKAHESTASGLASQTMG